MLDILTNLVKSIVTNPESVSIHEEEKEGFTHFIISADPNDIGKIIGKEGKVIRSLRNVMKIPAIKQGKRINISLAETEAK